MADYEVGYKKPPVHTRFKKGQSGHQSGRPKDKDRPYAALLDGVLQRPVEHREGGRRKYSPTNEFLIKKLIEAAIRRSHKAADVLLELHAQGSQSNASESVQILVEGWLPDRLAPTGVQATRENNTSAESRLPNDDGEATSQPKVPKK